MACSPTSRTGDTNTNRPLFAQSPLRAPGPPTSPECPPDTSDSSPPSSVSALACPHGMAECWLMQNILKKKNANNVGYAVATTSAPRTPAPCPLNPTSSPSRRSNRPSADSKNGRAVVLPRQEPAILAFHSPHTPHPPPLALSYATEPQPHATKPPPGRH